MTRPNVRLPPMGPAVDLNELVAGGMGTFATRYMRAGDGRQYPAEAGSIGDPWADYVHAAVIVPGEAAFMVVDLPSAALIASLEAGFEFALEARFTGCVEVTGTGEATDTVVALRIGYFDSDNAFVSLAPGGSGTAFVTFGEDANQSVALSANRKLDAFDLADDATSVPIQVRWGILGGEEGTEAAMSINNEDFEGGTGGWDFTLQWVLRPVADPG